MKTMVCVLLAFALTGCYNLYSQEQRDRDSMKQNSTPMNIPKHTYCNQVGTTTMCSTY